MRAAHQKIGKRMIYAGLAWIGAVPLTPILGLDSRAWAGPMIGYGALSMVGGAGYWVLASVFLRD